MSRKSTIRMKPQLDLTTEKLHQLQQRAQDGVSLAAGRVAPVAQQARELAAERVLLAREWSAPRLDLAARFVESELGPRVGSLLSQTARRIEPPKPTHKARNAALLGAAGAAGVGVAGALAMRRRGAQEHNGAQSAAESLSGSDAGYGTGPGVGSAAGSTTGPASGSGPGSDAESGSGPKPPSSG